jgi:YidC/Oxa1 family membrane protein insertase
MRRKLRANLSEYQNPNQEPGMEKRLLFVFALTFLVLLIAQPLITKYTGKSQPEQKPAVTQPAPQQNAPAQSATVAPGASAAVTNVARKAATSEQETVIDTPVYKVTFTNKGGQVKSWVLKDFTGENGKPLDLVNQEASRTYGYPLSLFTYDQGLREKLNSALYVVSQSGDKQRTITFEYADGDVDVRKSFTFDMAPSAKKPGNPSDYVVKADVVVTRNGQMVAAFPAWPAGFGDENTQLSYVAGRIDYLPTSSDKVTRLSPDKKGEKIGNFHTIPGPFYWGGTLDQYFAAVFLPDNPDQAALVQYRNSIEIPKNPGEKRSTETTKVEVLGAAVGNLSRPTSTRMFVGPNSVEILDAIRATPLPGQTHVPDLGSLVDFGFFGIIAKPLFLWLKWTQAHWASNWGWSIVILTVIINLALLPLRITSMKSALKMQKVQPQVNAIKKKYEKYPMRDPRRQEMNVEIQALFKQSGVNPLGGCLPMIIQMPFLFAFYTMLGVTTELRHAPWLWIKDLSAPDPYYILPVLIVVSTYYMQKMTPNAGMDPKQQKMMNLFMPIMLGWISYRLAAGLGVYWIIGTLIAVAQQFIMNRTSLGKEMKAEAEKRARKQVQKGTVVKR